jgi:hypothetical protein
MIGFPGFCWRYLKGRRGQLKERFYFELFAVMLNAVKHLGKHYTTSEKNEILQG